MATARTRKARSRETEKTVATRLQPLFPKAVAVPSALPGKDILNTPGVAVEAKARRGLDLPAWLRQAGRNATEDEIPMVVHRPDGFGPESVDDWPCTTRFGDMMRLLERAGIGGEE